MNAKLTLKLNSFVIEQAKSFARKRNTSLSKMIENYLKKLAIDSETNKSNISPLVKSLTGITKENGRNQKAAYSKYLSEKYK